MDKNTKTIELLRAAKFTVISISAGIIQIGLFTLLNELFKWNYWVSYLISLLTSIVWNFTINRKKVFEKDAPLGKSLFRYYCIALPHMLISATALAFLEQSPAFTSEFSITLLAAAINCALYFLSYFFQKKWVFKSKNP